MPKHLSTGDAKPAFDGKNKFRVYSMRYCPFAQRVSLVLAAKEITDYDIVYVKLRGELPEWYSSINPAKQVPALEFSNGDVVYESLLSADMLDELYSNNRLHPSDPVKKAKQRLFVAVFGNTYIPSFYKYIQEKTEENKEALLDNILKCEKHLADGNLQFFGGDRPAMVDYMIWPFFERLPMAYAISSELHPKLNAWCQKMQELPAVKKIALPADIYTKFYEAAFKGESNYDLV